MGKTFKWLADSCYDRKGRHLEKGKEYDAADFNEATLKEWEKSGAAGPADPGPGKKGKGE